METAESVAIAAERLKDEIWRIRRQVDRLDDIVLSINYPEIEGELRSVAAEIREAIDFMSEELEPEEPWLSG